MISAMELFFRSAFQWFEVRRGIKQDPTPLETDRALGDAIRGIYPNNPVNAFAGLKNIPLRMYFQPTDSIGREYLWVELRKPVVAAERGGYTYPYMRITLDDPEDDYEWATTLATKLPDNAILLFQDLKTLTHCPRDTNGDGDCGQRHCPYCGDRR